MPTRYTAEQIIQRTDRFSGNRATWESRWQDCADYVDPWANEITKTLTAGQYRRREIFATTAINDNETFMAGMSSYMIPNKLWFGLMPKNKILAEDDDVKRWFMDVTQTTYEALVNSNFMKKANEVFRSLGWCGTALMFAEEGANSPVTFSTYHIKRFFIDEGVDGEIDTFTVVAEYTARQAAQRWPAEKLSTGLQAALKDPKKMDDKFEFIHTVYPRTDFDPRKRNRDNLPWESVWVDKKAKHIVETGGFHEQPYFCPRYAVATNESYGRSPAMMVLTNIKVENKVEKVTLVAADKLVDPTILIPNDGSIHPHKTAPGSFMYYNPKHGADGIPRPLQTGGNLPVGFETIERQKQMIHAAFHTDLWALLSQRTDQKTAFETAELIDEKITLLGPILAPLESDFLSKTIVRVVGLMHRAGRYPPMPEALMEDPEFEIEYSNRITLAVKAQKSRAASAVLERVVPLAQLDPGVLDNFDLDAYARETAENEGTSIEFLRSKADRDEMRAMRAEQQQAQQQMEIAQQMAQMAQTVPSLQKPTEAGSPLEQLQEVI